MDKRSKRVMAGTVFAVLMFSFASAMAEFDPKACYERCMEKQKDREKCEYICTPKK